MMTRAQRAGMAGTLILATLVSNAASAAGVDTGTSSMTSITTWMMTWIPLSAVILIVVSAIAWIAHLIRMDWAVRLVVGLIVVGSASYIVGLFGLTA